MALTLKQQKEIEADIHEQLYSNIFILTLKYPTSKEFNACFKKDMFMKNNKAAYLQVIHFLLNILEPTFFKQRNIWPILDMKMETQFRNELMKYLNELNNTNKETGIPLLMTSHLISPGGYRFADFIFRLSQFVLFEDVRRETGNNLIPFPPRAPSTNSIASEQVKNMEQIIETQCKNLIEKQKKFELKIKEAKESIETIRSQEPIIKQKTIEVEKKIDAQNESHFTDILQTLPQRQSSLEGELMRLEIDSHSFEKCSTLITILNENKNIVNCSVDINNTQIPQQSKLKYHVDLIEYFESLLESIKTNKYIIKNRKEPNLPEYVESFTEILQDLKEHNEKYEELIAELELCISHLENYDLNSVKRTLHKYGALSQKIRKLFKAIPHINFSM